MIELVRRAVSCPGSLPTAAKATLLVTIGWQDLLAELGAGTTIASCDAGTLLGPAAIRRLACDAGIIPAVLGTDGQVLDLGRESRWFTPAQAKALWLRDRACTIPDRSMPAPPSGATRTTCGTSPTADPPTWHTPPCSAATTTPGSTDTASPDASTTATSPGTSPPAPTTATTAN